MGKLVLLRHGESVWNQENRFTGWTDVDLSAKGLGEAAAAGELLKKEGYQFDICITSVLTRAIRTAWIALDKLNLMWIPQEHDWRLNERHYGALQGLNKKETAAKHGEEQVFIWRRSYDIPPPKLEVTDERHPSHDPRYKGLKAELLPSTEALKQTVDRVLPAWQQSILPRMQAGQRVLVVAHGNSIRAMIKFLANVPDDEIVELNIPTGIPLEMKFDSQWRLTERNYLGDAAAIEAAVQGVKNQGKK